MDPTVMAATAPSMRGAALRWAGCCAGLQLAEMALFCVGAAEPVEFSLLLVMMSSRIVN